MNMQLEQNDVLPDKRLYAAGIPVIGTANKNALPSLMKLVAMNTIYTEGAPEEVTFDANIPAIGVANINYLPDIVGLVNKNKINTDSDGIVFPKGTICNVVILAVGIQNKKYLPIAEALVGKNTASPAQSRGTIQK